MNLLHLPPLRGKRYRLQSRHLPRPDYLLPNLAAPLTNLVDPLRLCHSCRMLGRPCQSCVKKRLYWLLHTDQTLGVITLQLKNLTIRHLYWFLDTDQTLGNHITTQKCNNQAFGLYLSVLNQILMRVEGDTIQGIFSEIFNIETKDFKGNIGVFHVFHVNIIC